MRHEGYYPPYPPCPDDQCHGHGPHDECCPPPKYPNDCCPPPPSLVPPPIPPVRYIPGMNVQQQLCDMASHVNESIDRWNQIQANCYKALDNMVGAAINNDVYYSKKDVRIYNGYSTEDSCNYKIIEARAVDACGKPIFMHLVPAYNNVTNNGSRQSIEDVSFITSANAIMTAVNPADGGWAGQAIFYGDPGEAGETKDGQWICGWTREGVLKFFPANADITVLRQNRMVNCIGPVVPILDEGELTYQAQNYNVTKSAIQAIGWKQCNGNKIMFSCGLEDETGMSVIGVANVLKKMGCTRAVITCIQSTYGQPSVVPPIQPPPEPPEPENPGEDTEAYKLTPEQNAALGLTGGMLYIGQLSEAPMEWQIPSNAAFWVISKKLPRNNWPNDFTTEVADTCQRLGFTENNLSSIQGKLNQSAADLLSLKARMATAEANITTLQSDMTVVQSRLDDADERIQQNADAITALQEKTVDLQNQITKEVSDREEADTALQENINAEANAREAADNALQENINAEVTARQTEDTKLQNNIDNLTTQLQEEAQTRNQADQNLINAINNEVLARQTADTQLSTAISNEEAARKAEDAKLQSAIDNVKDSIGPATTEKLGLVQIGDGIKVTDEGVISVDVNLKLDLEAGEGILVTQDSTTGTTTVAANTNVLATQEWVKEQGTGGGTSFQAGDGLAMDDSTTPPTLSVDAATAPKATDTTPGVVTVGSNISVTDGTISVPVASTSQLGVIRVGNNLSVDANGVMSVVDAEGKPITEGEIVEAGAGIDVTHDSEAKTATVSVKHDNTLSVTADTNTIGVDTAIVNAGPNQMIADLDNKVDAVTDSLTGEIATLKNEIDGNETTTGLKQQVQELNTKVNGDSTAEPPVQGLEQKVDALDKAVNGDSTAEPPTTGLAGEVADLKTELEGTESQPGLDARVGQLENTAIRDVTGNGNISVTVGTNRSATVSMANTPDVNGIDISDEDDFDNKVKLRTVGQTTESSPILTMADPVDRNVVVRGVGTPLENTDAANKAYVDAAVPDVSDLQSQITAVKTTADGALQRSGGVQTGWITGPITLMSGGTLGCSNGGKIEINVKGTSDDVIGNIVPSGEQTNVLPCVSKKSNGQPFFGFVRNEGNGIVNNNLRTRLNGIATPLYASDAVPKDYVDGGLANHKNNSITATTNFSVSCDNIPVIFYNSIGYGSNVLCIIDTYIRVTSTTTLSSNTISTLTISGLNNFTPIMIYLRELKDGFNLPHNETFLHPNNITLNNFQIIFRNPSSKTLNNNSYLCRMTIYGIIH